MRFHCVNIIDCHEANASRNDKKPTTASLRGEVEAIHNLANQNTQWNLTKRDPRLLQFLTESCNDESRAVSLPTQALQSTM